MKKVNTAQKFKATYIVTWDGKLYFCAEDGKSLGIMFRDRSVGIYGSLYTGGCIPKNVIREETLIKRFNSILSHARNMDKQQRVRNND